MFDQAQLAPSVEHETLKIVVSKLFYPNPQKHYIVTQVCICILKFNKTTNLTFVGCYSKLYILFNFFNDGQDPEINFMIQSWLLIPV